MKYMLNQFNQSKQDNVPAEDVSYMTLIKEGEAIRKKSLLDYGVLEPALPKFFDECVQIPKGTLNFEKHYYFHVKVKRLNTNQEFNIYLINNQDQEVFDANDNLEEMQFLKKIQIQPVGDNNLWADVAFSFTPVNNNFNCIMFQLKRTADDYYKAREATIIYEELSEIKNNINTISGIKNDIGFIKIGVQSRPGMLMCINGEEIKVGRTGTYELKNGMVVTDFFSVLNTAVERDEEEFNKMMEDLYTKEDTESIGKTNSVCIFGNPKNRNLDAFSMDYIYKEEVQG